MFYLFLVIFLISGNVFAQVVKIDKQTFSQPVTQTVEQLKSQIQSIDISIAGSQRDLDLLNAKRTDLINQLKAASAAGVTDADAVPGVK